jgi:2-iminobutanoate/2-iminopropanoate deaminase
MAAHTIPQFKLLFKPTGYSHAARAGQTLFIAGQVAQDRTGKLVGKGDFEAQAKQVYTNLVNILKESGGAPQNVVKMTTFITHPSYLEAFRKVRGQFFTEPLPPNTLLVVESLASPDYMIEVEAIAVLDPPKV